MGEHRGHRHHRNRSHGPAGCWFTLDVDEALAPIPRSPAPWEYELTVLRDDVALLETRLAASEASLRREVHLRLKAERLCNQASHGHNAALEILRRIRLDHANADRELVATNIALEQSSQAAAVLEQRCRRLDKPLADTHKVIRHEREQFKAGISSYAVQLRQPREYLQQSDRQSSVSGGASPASASAMPAAFVTLLEELGALQLAIPPTSSGSSEGSGLARRASSGSLHGAGAKSGSSTSLAVDSDGSDDSGPTVPSALHKGKGKRPAKPSAKLQSAPPTPKKKQRFGRPSVDLKARRAAKQAASAMVSMGGPPQSIPSSLSAASLPTSGSDSPFSPIPRTPASPASSTASTASLPSTPVVSRGIAPGTEASVPVEIDDDGGLGADGAASDASDAPGGGGDIELGTSSNGQHPHGSNPSSSCGGQSDASASFDLPRPDRGNSHPVHGAWNSVYGFRACDRYSGSNPRPAASGTGITEASRFGLPSVGACIHGSRGSRGLVRDIERSHSPAHCQ
ncbi:unnamed protein product [Phytophthora fragariaefolia]|uniref:Unnamed protein product n=1 Tax=Phytophthora fragariaefolia TaxID=1490495 RepID=A0A9W6Y6I1_9STRA|nr:unnamed protein product [Phytophthora fragariaefolia]